MMPTVIIIVLNWNNAPDTVRCLRSLKQLDYENHRVIVVDNGSSDDSVATIAATHPDITILENGENLGYAGGNSVGIEYALNNGCDYVWLLNDDVTVAPDSLLHMHEDPQRILSAGGRFGSCWQPQHRGMGELDSGQFDAISEVDFLSGCALLVNQELIEKIGGLDSDFFVYHEDVEWCYRGNQAGFRTLFVPQSKVWHPDTRRRDADSALVTYYIARNQLLFMTKHHLGVGAITRCLANYMLWVVNWSINPKWRHKRCQRDMLLRAMLDFSRGHFGKAGCFS